MAEQVEVEDEAGGEESLRPCPAPGHAPAQPRTPGYSP